MKQDYTVLDKDNYPRRLADDEIAVACGMSVFGQTCPETYYHQGKEYKRGEIDSIPNELIGQISSVRIFKLKK